MKQDISESREKRQRSVGERISEAVRDSQSATDMFDEAMTQFLGINRTDGRCLDIVDRRGRVTAGQLAGESGLTTGAVTAVIDRLETAGYLRRSRDETDRRKVWIETTEELRQIAASIFGHFERINPVLMERFSLEQVAAIVEFLEMSALLNRELAGVLRNHIDPAAKTLAARLASAGAFERAVDAGMEAMDGALRSIRFDPANLE